MKYYNKTKQIKTFIAFVFVSLGLLSACEDSLEIGKVDESNYEISEHNIGYLMDGNGKNDMSLVEFRTEGELDIYMALTNTANENATVSVKYDSKVFEDYNAEHNTNVELLPQGLVTFEGDIEIKKGSKKSEKMLVKFITDQALDASKTYVIPVSTELKSGSIKLAEKESKFMILVKDFSKYPSPAKSTGIEIISCMEINDTNPLNNLAFTLKGSNKPFIDQVILFSANINYDLETGKVYVLQNRNIEHLLSNRDKYIKPLQDRGIKVVLGILGNHDRSGVANLGDESARAFAQELKAICDAYDLDGIFFDDEYSDYNYTNPLPGFVIPSNEAASRLCYETKMAMPDKIVSVYAWGRTAYLTPIEGKQPGEFIDYALHDYGMGYDFTSSYPGLPKSKWGMYSSELNYGSYPNNTNLQKLRDGGYGAHMIFAMDPLRANFKTIGSREGQLDAMKRMTPILFDDELVTDGIYYKKDW